MSTVADHIARAEEFAGIAAQALESNLPGALSYSSLANAHATIAIAKVAQYDAGLLASGRDARPV